MLSRVGAAVDQGNLRSALDEIAALPEAGQQAMADWVDRAGTRRDALAAAETLRAAVDGN